jgi:hypothetical protein
MVERRGIAAGSAGDHQVIDVDGDFFHAALGGAVEFQSRHF